MSVLLALDTATSTGSVAIASDGQLLGERVIGSSVRHAESLLPAIADLLEMHRFTPADLSGVIVGAGPGSFTGVRVAAATARGLVRALGIPLFAYNSLLATAMAAKSRKPVCALFDARRGEVYAGCWRFSEAATTIGEAGWQTLLEPVAAPVEDVLAAVETHEPLFVGDGAHLAGFVDQDLPRAAALLSLATASPEEGRVSVPARWEPEYLRPWGTVRP